MDKPLCFSCSSFCIIRTLDNKFHALCANFGPGIPMGKHPITGEIRPNVMECMAFNPVTDANPNTDDKPSLEISR